MKETLLRGNGGERSGRIARQKNTKPPHEGGLVLNACENETLEVIDLVSL